MTNKEICFVIVFNHNFERNIEKLRKIYKGRFNDIFILMPFYAGNEPDVIAVYGSSFYFQGYFPQALNRIYNDKYSHYVFIADDLLLNPKIDFSNITSELQLDGSSAYIKSLCALNDVYYLWIYLTKIFEAFSEWTTAARQLLPPASETRESLAKHGISVKDLSYKNLKHWDGNYRLADFYNYKNFWKQIFRLRKKRPLPYPLAAGYADFVVIPADAIKRFCHLCGIFAAMNLWVEVSIPTAMLMSCEKIFTEIEVGKNWVAQGERARGDVLWRGLELWDDKDVQRLEEKNNRNLNELFSAFDEHLLYIHPVKLSRWEL